MRPARGLGDGDGHEADDADAGDEDALGGDIGGHDGVDGVAERVEDGRDLVGDGRVDGPDVFLGHTDVVGEAAVAVDADDLGVAGDVGVAGAAVVVGPLGGVALGG
jgi:hypothetical protein